MNAENRSENGGTPGVDLLATDRLLIAGGNPDLAERLREINCTCGHGPEPSEIHERECPYWDGTWPETPCGDQITSPAETGDRP